MESGNNSSKLLSISPCPPLPPTPPLYCAHALCTHVSSRPLGRPCRVRDHLLYGLRCQAQGAYGLPEVYTLLSQPKGDNCKQICLPCQHVALLGCVGYIFLSLYRGVVINYGEGRLQKGIGGGRVK